VTEQARDDDRTVALPVVERDRQNGADAPGRSSDETVALDPRSGFDETEAASSGGRRAWLRQPSFAGLPRATWIGIVLAAALALVAAYFLGYTVGRLNTESAYQRANAPAADTHTQTNYGAIVVDNEGLQVPQDIMEGGNEKTYLGMEPVVLVILAVMLVFIAFVAWQITLLPLQ